MARTFAASTQFSTDVLRVATYNIHKGVRGVGPRKRLEIHNLGLGIEALDADLVFLQEVRSFHHGEARRFERTWFGWPKVGQADFLAPEGYDVAYRTNAITRDGEHGNALLSRWPIGDIGHHDVSDHRFEQRGLLHVPVRWNGQTVHAVVAHDLGVPHDLRIVRTPASSAVRRTYRDDLEGRRRGDRVVVDLRRVAVVALVAAEPRDEIAVRRLPESAGERPRAEFVVSAIDHRGRGVPRGAGLQKCGHVASAARCKLRADL